MKGCFVAAAMLATVTSAQAQVRPSVAPRNMQAIAPALADYTDEVLFGDVWRRPGLSARDRSLVTLSVLIATGKTAQLRGHLGRGLTNGIRPREVAGLTTHLAFYAGWPNAVSALNVIEQVFAERKIDASELRLPPDARAPIGAGEASRVPAMTGRSALASPKLAELTDEVLFGDLWRRADLSPRDRSLVTIAALAASGDREQLGLYVRRGLDDGLTRGELGEAIAHLAFYAGWPKAVAAAEVVSALPDATPGATAPAASKIRVVPPGQAPRPGPASNFDGAASVASAFKGTDGARIGGATVTFQARARTNWHTHPLGQLLIVTAGKGWVQAAGEPAQSIAAGDTIWTAPGVKHWHGAGHAGSMTHVAVSEALNGTSVTWMEPVARAEYDRLDRESKR